MLKYGPMHEERRAVFNRSRPKVTNIGFCQIDVTIENFPAEEMLTDNEMTVLECGLTVNLNNGISFHVRLSTSWILLQKSRILVDKGMTFQDFSKRFMILTELSCVMGGRSREGS